MECSGMKAEQEVARSTERLYTIVVCIIICVLPRGTWSERVEGVHPFCLCCLRFVSSWHLLTAT